MESLVLISDAAGRPRRAPAAPQQMADPESGLFPSLIRPDWKDVFRKGFRRIRESLRLFWAGCYPPTMKAKEARGVKAWLVTWHWLRDHPKREVAAIFSSRLGGVRVREFVELIWVTSKYFTFEEQLSIKWPGGRTPYAARFGQTTEGDPWAGEVLCGNDPYLRARLVDGLTIGRDADGKEKVNWKERPRASSAWWHQEKQH
jgi:hypothetical protein